MADSPSRLLARARRASSSHPPQAQRPLPVWLYLPNLLCYLRLALSAYGLCMVAGTVRRRAEATAAAAAASPFKAVARLASSYVHPAAAAGGLLVSGTLLGRGLDHLLRAASSQLQTAGGTGSSSGGGGKDAIGGGSAAVVDADLLAALLVFALAAALDALDGHLARAYNQCSALGVVLDVVADIALRSALWIAAALLDPRWALPALGLITCEWLTLLASQVVSRSEGGRHWKRQREGDPWLVRQFFSRGFRNLLGVWGVGGLFLAPVWPLLRHCFPGWLLGAPPPTTSTDAADVARRVVQALFDGMGWVVLGGRLLSLGIEGYFILGLLRLLCEEGEGGGDDDDGGGDSAPARPVKAKGL